MYERKKATKIYERKNRKNQLKNFYARELFLRQGIISTCLSLLRRIFRGLPYHLVIELSRRNHLVNQT